MQHSKTPDHVRNWIGASPSWLEVRRLRIPPDSGLNELHEGERQAIALAEEVQPNRLLIDEMDARRHAFRRQLPVMGTLGILRRAADLDWIDFRTAIGRLRQTTFYVDDKLIQALLR